MKRKNLQKVLALTLAGMMAAGSLTACGNSDSGKESDPAPSVSAAGEKSQEPAGESGSESESEISADGTGMESWEAFSENVTLKIPVYDRGREGVPDVSDNYWTGWIQENFGDKYNITVKFIPITRTDVMTDYTLLASSKSLPTILMEYDYPKTSQWANEGYLTTFNMDDFAQTAPTFYNRMVEQDQLAYAEMAGETYFVLAERTYYGNPYAWQTFVRMDWLEEVGYDHVPANREEYLDAMQKIMDAGICEHPGGGHKLTGVGEDLTHPFRTLPQKEEEWVMYGDYTINSLTWDANYRLIKNANEDYNLGILNPEYYIIDASTDEVANFVNGMQYSLGMYINQCTDTLNSLWSNDPDAKLALQPIDAYYGENPAWRANNPFGMIIGFSNTATEDEIKAAWMYIEWMSQPENLFTMQWGFEGENYNLDENGLPVSVVDYEGEYKQGYSYNADYYCVITSARDTGTIEQIITYAFPQGFEQSPELTQQIIDYYYRCEELAKEGNSIIDCMFSVAINSEAEYRDTLVALYTEYRDKLTMCKPEEFDALYEKYCQEYLDAGFQEVIDERLAAYEAGNTTRLQ